MQTLLPILNSVGPVFLIIALGAGLRATQFLSETFFRDLNRLVYWVGLPVLLFHKIAEASFTGGEAMRIFWVLLAGTLVAAAAGYAASALLRLPRSSWGAFVQTCFRGNLVYAGLPVIVYALAPDGGTAPRALETTAILAIAPLVPLYNLGAIVVLLRHGRSTSRPSLGCLLWETLRNPLFVACILGFVFPLADWHLPKLALRTCTAVGQMALPLALISLGTSLRLERIRGDFLPAFAASLVKIAFAPLVGYAIARGVSLAPDQIRIVVIYLACPTAAASYIMAEQLGGDAELTGSVVVLSTFLALVSLSVAVAVG